MEHRKQDKPTTHHHVLKFTSLFGGVQGLKLAVSVLRNKLASLLLGTSGFGLLAVYSSITDFVTNVCNCGIPINATQHTSELYAQCSDHELRAFALCARTWIVWAGLAAMLLSAVLSPALSYFFFDRQLTHALEIVALTPVVIAYLVAECECSLLKGMRQLRAVATIECVVAVTTLLSTIPFYYYWGLRGIIAALITSTTLSAIIHLRWSTRLLPYRIRPFSAEVLRRGWPFVRRGLPYVLAGIAGSASLLAVPLIILSTGTLAHAGLFRAAYAMMVGYAGMAFVALEADYYPRLSTTRHRPHNMSQCVNQQIEVCVLLIAPLQTLLVVCLPLVVHILYTPHFAPVVAMATCAAFHTFFRAMMLPIAYIPLAWGKSRVYLLVELASYALFCLGMWAGWALGQLTGMGVALSWTALLDLVLVYATYSRLYGYRLHPRVLCHAIVQGTLLAITMTACLMPLPQFRLGVGLLAIVAAAAYSLRMLRRSGCFDSSHTP